MNIVEALQSTTEKKPYIARKVWLQERTKTMGESCYLQVTESVGCVQHSRILEKASEWIPKLSDLLADDWEVVHGL